MATTRFTGQITNTHLLRGIQLQQAPAEGGSSGEVLQLVEQNHGRAQAEDDVARLQLGMREVRRQLSLPVGLCRGLALQLSPQAHIVLPE
jgi:hypothetical protein